MIHAESAERRTRRRHRAAGRPDRARAGQGARRRLACRSSAPAPRRSTWRRSAARSPASSTRPDCCAPRNGTATDAPTAVAVAEGIGYPVLVRPSLRARRPRHGDRLRQPSRWRLLRPGRRHGDHRPGSPLLVDRFIDDAMEIDVDALYDGTELYIGGIMEHIEEAGIHSGDSSCTLPPVTLGRDVIDRVRDRDPARSPRASGCAACSTCSSPSAPGCSTCSRPTRAPRRTVPFVSKALGIPLAKAAALIMVGAQHPRSGRLGHAAASSDGSRGADGLAGRGEGGGAAVQAVPHQGGPHRRLRARPGDALDRRGDGHRRRLPEGVREEPGWPRTAACPPPARCSCRSPTATSAPSCCRCCGCSSSGFTIVATEGTAEMLARNGIAARRSCASTARQDRPAATSRRSSS